MSELSGIGSRYDTGLIRVDVSIDFNDIEEVITKTVKIFYNRTLDPDNREWVQIIETNDLMESMRIMVNLRRDLSRMIEHMRTFIVEEREKDEYNRLRKEM